MIDSLVKSSEKKMESNKRLELDETTASTKVTVIYESLREILEAIAIKKGFKIYNHECFYSFLREICNDKTSSNGFNKFRLLRNQINYYGKNVPVKDAEVIIREIILLRKKLVEKYA